jgi:hypothetical protein
MLPAILGIEVEDVLHRIAERDRGDGFGKGHNTTVLQSWYSSTSTRS